MRNCSPRLRPSWRRSMPRMSCCGSRKARPRPSRNRRPCRPNCPIRKSATSAMIPVCPPPACLTGRDCPQPCLSTSQGLSLAIRDGNQMRAGQHYPVETIAALHEDHKRNGCSPVTFCGYWTFFRPIVFLCLSSFASFEPSWFSSRLHNRGVAGLMGSRQCWAPWTLSFRL
jgi:hypothetical protein